MLAYLGIDLRFGNRLFRIPKKDVNMYKIMKSCLRMTVKALTVDGDAFSTSKEWPFLWSKSRKSSN